MDKNSIDPETIYQSQAYRSSRADAEKLVNQPDEMEKRLVALEEKFQKIPKIGNVLTNIPLLISMVRSYIQKKYTAVPIATIIGISTALLYVLLPFDLIADILPGIGYLDDAALIALTLMFVGNDLKAYKEWRDAKQNAIEVDETDIK